MSIRRARRPLRLHFVIRSNQFFPREDDLKINNELSDCQQHVIREVLTQFKDLFSEIPGRAKDRYVLETTPQYIYKHTVFHYTNTR